MRTLVPALAIVACASLVVGASMEMSGMDIVDLGVDPSVVAEPKGAISLAQLRESAFMAVRGQEAMTDAMAEKAKHTFIKLAASFKSEALRADSIGTVRMAQHILLGEGSKTTGSGLDLIFRKLNELKKKIETEQKDEKKNNQMLNAGCQKTFKDNNAIIGSSSKTRATNANIIGKASLAIKNDRDEWRMSRKTEDDTHASLVELQAVRAEESDAIRARVDERNKAIDVMVKATFMVCERFNRYKDTKQCQEIRAQPDIDEPHRYETKPYDKAKEQTTESHKGGDPPTKWFADWKKQVKKDIKLEGKNDPEGLIKNPTTGAKGGKKKPAKSETQRLREAADHDSTVVALLQEEGNSRVHQTTLSADEARACRELNLLTNSAKLAHQYALPLNELALSIRSGNTRRSKSIVEILLSVLKETREEQAVDKEKHQINLDKYFKSSWEMAKILIDEDNFQKQTRARMEKNRVTIRERMSENEEQRRNQNKALAARTEKEDSCGISNEEYGVREAIRLEDLENLAKLKSLLRALYDKKMPKDCPNHNRVMCTGKDNGWCIYVGKSPSNEQRCSCNVGFYGDACQYRMCPGGSKNLYEANAPGACSDRGKCNPLNGMCTCGAAFYHGPKNACDYKHTPKDLAGNWDTCSGKSRGTVDPVRGICTCKEEFFAPACEQRKCPNSNGVVYPVISGNACNGRGACSIKKGTCKCNEMYFGKSCEYEKCPENCRGRGTCNDVTGKCACNKGWHGHACEFQSCPNDCSGGGKCNRNDGVCLCSMGYSGVQCEKTKRCTAANLNNNKMNWWTVWDKPGWMVCPKGQLMYQLKRSLCDALSCIESGGCAAGCEGDKHVFQLRHCYHDLRWYTSFDKAGWSKCLPDYFVAGLFRSCESLYCLNMAKCCSLKQARWAQCGNANWGGVFNGPGTGKLPNAHVFITGFRRSEGHTIKSLDEASYCGFVRGY